MAPHGTALIRVQRGSRVNFDLLMAQDERWGGWQSSRGSNQSHRGVTHRCVCVCLGAARHLTEDLPSLLALSLTCFSSEVKGQGLAIEPCETVSVQCSISMLALSGNVLRHQTSDSSSVRHRTATFSSSGGGLNSSKPQEGMRNLNDSGPSPGNKDPHTHDPHPTAGPPQISPTGISSWETLVRAGI